VTAEIVYRPSFAGYDGAFCPECDNPVGAACAFSGHERTFMFSHSCPKENRTLVVCPCGDFAWGNNTDEAVAGIGHGWRR